MLRLVARWRTALLATAAALTAAAIFLPLWGMTLVSTQYPEGLRMVVFASRIAGDLNEINALNRYIGMTPISSGFFTELRLLPAAFATIALVTLLAAWLRRRELTVTALVLMGTVAGYGFWSMQRRLYQFGHDLNPSAPITIEPFTPPMLGLNQIAQFASYSYFSWGTFLPLVAGVLVALVLAAEIRRGDPRRAALPLAVAA